MHGRNHCACKHCCSNQRCHMSACQIHAAISVIAGKNYQVKVPRAALRHFILTRSCHANRLSQPMCREGVSCVKQKENLFPAQDVALAFKATCAGTAPANSPRSRHGTLFFKQMHRSGHACGTGLLRSRQVRLHKTGANSLCRFARNFRRGSAPHWLPSANGPQAVLRRCRFR